MFISNIEEAIMARETNKTVGIVTINDYTNYGNRLQNYALTTLFRNYGFEVAIGGIKKSSTMNEAYPTWISI